MKILIVEDDVSMNDLIKKHLSLVGYECIQVCDGNAAVNAALENNFSLIILDVMLPGLSGFGVMEKIRESGVTGDISDGKIRSVRQAERASRRS